MAAVVKIHEVKSGTKPIGLCHFIINIKYKIDIYKDMYKEKVHVKFRVDPGKSSEIIG